MVQDKEGFSTSGRKIPAGVKLPGLNYIAQADLLISSRKLFISMYWYKIEELK